MERCPKCGRYMESYLKRIFGGWCTVWTCLCGYTSEESKTAWDNKTN